MTKSEILASNMPPVEKVWECAKDRKDMGAGAYGVIVDIQQHYARYGNSCCAVGAVLDGQPVLTGDYPIDSARLLGVSVEWIAGLIYGFDDVELEDDGDSDGYAAGQEIRRRFEAMGVRLG